METEALMWVKQTTAHSLVREQHEPAALMLPQPSELNRALDAGEEVIACAASR
jgi:hypothetical protein